eukprot:322210-Rhodomonas_salina.2
MKLFGLEAASFVSLANTAEVHFPSVHNALDTRLEFRASRVRCHLPNRPCVMCDTELGHDGTRR